MIFNKTYRDKFIFFFNRERDILVGLNIDY